MRKALVVGIDYYQNFSQLRGCVNDAHAVSSILERHGDGTPNFGVKIMTGTCAGSSVQKAAFKSALQELFRDDVEIALLYFAGHGHVQETGGYLLTSDVTASDEGVQLNEILTLAHGSPAKNKVLVLDSCHSGVAGNLDVARSFAQISEGMTILTAAAANQYADEEDGSGVFTTLFVDALAGAAANLVGAITPGSIYAHIDQSLGPWDQRPLFKTNVKSFVELRRVHPPIPLADLQRIKDIFPMAGFEFALDPSFEPESPSPDPEKTAQFAVLQQYNRVNLVIPVGATHMYHAAMESKSCRLTVLGEHYRRLADKKRI